MAGEGKEDVGGGVKNNGNMDTAKECNEASDNEVIGPDVSGERTKAMKGAMMI